MAFNTLRNPRYRQNLSPLPRFCGSTQLETQTPQRPKPVGSPLAAQGQHVGNALTGSLVDIDDAVEKAPMANDSAIALYAQTQIPAHFDCSHFRAALGAVVRYLARSS